MNKKEGEAIIILLAVILFIGFVLFLKPAAEGFVIYEPQLSYNESLVSHSDGYRLIANAETETHNITFRQEVNGYAGCEDAFIDEDNGDNSYATTTGKEVRDLANKRKRYLVKFNNILDSVPENAEIVSAKLVLWTNKEAGQAIIYLHEIKKEWIEGNYNGKLPHSGKYGCTWNNSKLYYSGEGESAIWESAGLDGSSDKSSLISSVTINNENIINLNIKQSIEAWLAGSSNFGWIIIGDSANGAKNLYSKEAGSESKRPYLEIIYNTLNYAYITGAEIESEEFAPANLSSWNYIDVNFTGVVEKYYSTDSGAVWSNLSSDELNEINSTSIKFKFKLNSEDAVLYSAKVNYSLLEFIPILPENQTGNETAGNETAGNQTEGEQNQTSNETQQTEQQAEKTGDTGEGPSSGPSNFKGITITNAKTETEIKTEAFSEQSGISEKSRSFAEKEETKELRLYEQSGEGKEGALSSREMQTGMLPKETGKYKANSSAIIGFAGIMLVIISCYIISRKIRRKTEN